MSHHARTGGVFSVVSGALGIVFALLMVGSSIMPGVTYGSVISLLIVAAFLGVVGVLAVVGGVGLATASPAPPFTVGATRPGYGFPRRTFEPSDERQTFELTGVPDPEPSPSEPEPPESGGRP